jgi:ABC-type bacteriocin/lantibiotic exporter with double-glycine peptidase domain
VRIQDDNYSCGACAVLNALESVGIEVDLGQIESLAGTTPQGTDENGIMQAIDRLGLSSEVIAHSGPGSADVAKDWWWTSVWRGVLDGGPAIVYSRSRQHWMVLSGLLGDRMTLLDSDNDPANVAANGVHSVDRDSLMDRTGGELYAIRVVAPQRARAVAL